MQSATVRLELYAFNGVRRRAVDLDGLCKLAQQRQWWMYRGFSPARISFV